MDPQARPSTLLPASSLILLLAGFGGWLLYDQPLTSLRPVTPKAFERGNNGSEDVEARLWQDPFRPAYEHRKSYFATNWKEDDPEALAHFHDHEILALARQIQKRVQELTDEEKLLLMPVLLPGGPYAEAVETRRRRRKAVLAGLSVVGYVPRWDEWIGYVEAPLGKQEGSRSRTLIPYEWFQRDPLLFGRPRGEREGTFLPRAKAPSVLVLWIDENDFPAAGLRRIARLLGELLGYRSADAAGQEEFVGERLDRVRFALLGPASSTTLLTLLDDDRPLYRAELQDLSTRQASAADLAELLTYITRDYLDCGLTSCPEPTEPPPNDSGGPGHERSSPNTDNRIEEVKKGLTAFFEASLASDDSEKDLPPIRRGQLRARLRELVPVKDSDPSWPATVTREWRGFLRDRHEFEIEWSEVEDWTEPLDVGEVLPRLEIFSSRSTASEQLILRILRKKLGQTGTSRTLAEIVEAVSGGARFHRTIVSDERLAEALVEELALREVRPGTPNSAHHIVLISERDSLYGRALPQTFSDVLKAKTQEACSEEQQITCIDRLVHRYSYLRGMDGNVAGGVGGASPEREASPNGSTPSLFSSQLLAVSPEALERPMGPGQLDEMRRLAQKIERLRSNLAGDEEIRAIGVLGSDVYDKQLVLQALQRRFPRALFFTTDLDARLLHPGDYSWNRNLLIASSFGLELREELQRHIPPFRDSYQTATFLATLLALDGSRQSNLWKECASSNGTSQPQDIEACLTPRLFEVARTGAFPLGLAVPDGGLQLHPDAKVSGWGGDGRRLVFGLLLSLALATVLVVPIHSSALAVVFPVGETERRNRRTVLWVLAVSAVAFGALTAVIYYDSGHPKGEPFQLWNGISLWPTEILRLLAFALSVFFLGGSLHRLRTNQEDLTRDYALPPCTPEDSPGIGSRWRKVLRRMARLDRWGFVYDLKPTLRKRLCRQLALLRRLRRWLSIHHWRMSTRKRDHQEAMEAEGLWRRYCILARPGHRLIRFIPWALVFLLFGFFLVDWMQPNRPVRGTWSSAADVGVLALSVLGLTGLTFFVVDATRLCQSFIRALADRRTSWPEPARQRVADQRGMRPEDMDDYLDLEMIADRSEVIGRLILYPFLVLFVMILSRSSFFDRWDWPLSLVLIMGSLAGLAVWCALALRRAAEKARSKAVKRLRARLSKALAGGSQEAGRADQLRLMLDELESLDRGAFAHWSRHPVLKAVLIPFGGVGLVTLVEFLATMGL